MEINNEKKKKGKSEREANPKSAGQDEQQRRITKAKGNDEENRAEREPGGKGRQASSSPKALRPKASMPANDRRSGEGSSPPGSRIWLSNSFSLSLISLFSS